MKNNPPVVISLGGSLIVPKEIDWLFLKKFRKVILKEVANGRRFVIISGGGNTARLYQKAAAKTISLTKDDRDWLGVHATRLNAHLIKTVFRKVAHPRINKNPRTKEDLSSHFAQGEGVMVAAGWRPGWSTDFVGVILAERLKAQTIINLSNIPFVFDKDPKQFPDAQKIEKINWKNFRKIVGNKWDPGLNAPFDPVAAKLAQKLKLQVIIADGKNINNFKKILTNKKFQGTIIQD